MAERKTLARSQVSAARSVGWKFGCTRAASIREKSSNVLTSLSKRRLLRCATDRSSRTASGTSAGLQARRASCKGPSINVSGVRNSWLTFEKKVVFARSSSASASTRFRSSS